MDTEARDQVVDVDMRRVRVFGLSPCWPVPSALCLAARRLAHGGRKAARGILEAYYATGFPPSAADVLGMDSTHALAGYPPLAAVLPWYQMSPDEYLRAMEEAIVGHAQQTGRPGWGVTDGHTQFGPVSSRKLDFELERLSSLVNSVRQHGVSSEHPPLLGGLVVDDRSAFWVFDVRDGLHRCAVFSAMDYQWARGQVVANLGPTVYRSQSADWPQVQSGLFSKEEALSVFDRYIAGRL